MAKSPPRPEPYRSTSHHICAPITHNVLFEPGHYFTAAQLRARDLEIWRMAMEAAAEEVEHQSMPVQARVACGWAIRALPEPSHD